MNWPALTECVLSHQYRKEEYEDKSRIFTSSPVNLTRTVIFCLRRPLPWRPTVCIRRCMKGIKEDLEQRAVREENNQKQQTQGSSDHDADKPKECLLVPLQIVLEPHIKSQLTPAKTMDIKGRQSSLREMSTNQPNNCLL